MSQGGNPTWRQVLATFAAIFLIAFIASIAGCAFWLRELYQPQIAILGSGNRLSLFVAEGPARLIIASGDDAVALENALTEVRPLFARRVDLLLISGDGTTLLAPLSARQDRHVRSSYAISQLPNSPEATALGPIGVLGSPRRIQIGPTMSLQLETAPAADDGALAAWRATVEHGATRVVVLSSAESAALFPPVPDVSLLVTDGQDLADAWDLSPALAIVANGDAVSGPDLRAAFVNGQGPQWGYRVDPGDALRLRFVDGALQLPAEGAQYPIAATPIANS